VLEIIAVATLILVGYLLYRLRPNKLASHIKFMTFCGVSDSILRRFAKIHYIMGRKEKIEVLNLNWPGWENYENSNMDVVMRVLGGYGGLFWRAIELKRFYFRELLNIAGSITNVRGWINDAIKLGIIRVDKDTHGVRVYRFDAECLRRVMVFLDKALEELIYGVRRGTVS